MNDLRIGAASKNVDVSRGRFIQHFPLMAHWVPIFLMTCGRINLYILLSIKGNYGIVLMHLAINGRTLFMNYMFLTAGRHCISHLPGYGNQLNNNFGQQVGLQLNIPIFNGNSSRTNYQKAQLRCFRKAH